MLVERLVARFTGAGPVDVGARMFFALFLLTTWVTTQQAVFLVPLRALALAALVFPPLHRNPTLWSVFALVMCAKTALNWFTQDNHIFLLTWFSVAMAFGLRTADPVRAIRAGGRWLIGLAFLFAALWKGSLSGEFLDGTYFSFTFLTDARFHGIARVLGAVPEDALASSYAAAKWLTTADVDSVVLAGLTPRLVFVATAAAWWTFAIEAALAVTFLAPERWPRIHAARHAVLLLFGVTTYLAIDVESFGWSLMAIGAAQSEPERRWLPAMYFAVGVLVLVYDYVPIFDLIAAHL